MKKLRIAIVTPLGAEPRLDNYAEFILAQGLVEHGFDVRFYTYKIKNNPLYKKNGMYKKVMAIRTRQKFGISPGLFFSLIFFRPSVVMYFHPRSFLNFTAYYAAKIIRARTLNEIVGILHDPFIVNDRDNPIETLKKDIHLITSWKELFFTCLSRGFSFLHWKNFLFHMPTAKADKIIAINKDEKNYIQKFYNRDSELIYWCIPKNQNLQTIEPSNEKYAQPFAKGWVGELPKDYVLFIGQLKKRKGWDTALEAIAELKNKGMRKNLIFVCSSKNIEEAKLGARGLGIENQVFFMIQISNEEKNWLYKHAQCVLVPSRYEGFGLPVFEAFTAGSAVLATHIPVFLEFLTHKKNAMISKMGDSQELAENIKILDENQALKQLLIQEGYKTALEFSDEKMVQKFLQLIKNELS